MVQVQIRFTGVNQWVAKLAHVATGLVGGARYTVGHSNALPYVKSVHDGSKPHIIRPRVKKALWWDGAAHPVALVNHPGYKGNPYLTNALDAQQEAINRAFVAGLRGLIAGGPGSIRTWAKESADLVLEDAKGRANRGKSGKLIADLHVSRG